MMRKIIIDGLRYDVLADVKTWHETGMKFVPGNGARKRTNDLDLVVWHYTGGEGDAARLFRVLGRRKLGVEFFISRKGTIWQFCDPVFVDTFDAGTANRRSVGIEIACYGHVSHGTKMPKKGTDRRRYLATVNGTNTSFAHFYPCQTAAAVSLAGALSDSLGIPFKVPITDDGDLLRCKMSEADLNIFHGHIGHYHVSDRKVDPGPALLEIFRLMSSGRM